MRVNDYFYGILLLSLLIWILSQLKQSMILLNYNCQLLPRMGSNAASFANAVRSDPE